MKIALKIVSIVGLVIWTACCFFGLFFATDGNYMVTVSVTLLFAVAMFLSYFLMRKMQDKSATQGNRDRAKTVGLIMLAIYVIASVCSAFYINHLVKSFNCKEEIQRRAANAINELNVTFSEDAGPNSYRAWVDEEKGRYERHLMNHPEEVGNNSIEKELADFESTLLPEDYEVLEANVNETTEQIKASVVDGWYIPTLLTRLKELQNKPLWEEQVVDYSTAHEYTKYDSFDKEIVSSEDCKSLTDELTHADFNISSIAILIVLALQLIILLGYLMSLKTGGKNDKIVTSDQGSMRSWSSK